MRLPLMPAAAIAVLPWLAFALASPSPTTAAESAPLVGTYDCQGVEPDGTPYRGLVQIVGNAGLYEVVWIFSSGQQYRGFGVVNGDALAVSYYTSRPGVVAYKIEHGDTGPKLTGHWTVAGADAAFRETLTRLSEKVIKLPRPEPPPAPAPAPLIHHLRPA
jgi:hypothetical protein